MVLSGFSPLDIEIERDKFFDVPKIRNDGEDDTTTILH